MQNLLLLTHLGATVPAIHGGPFETLATDIIELNEVRRKWNITCLCRYDEQAEKLAEKYRYTTFCYAHTDPEKEERFADCKVWNILNRITFKLLGRMVLMPPRMREALETVKGKNFDRILVLGGEIGEYSGFSHFFGREKMIFNVGGAFHGGKVSERVFSKFLCVSDHISDILEPNLNRSVCSSVTLRNCIDTGLFARTLSGEEKEDLIRTYNLRGKKTALFVGRISPEKGIRELIDAIPLMKEKENFVLLIAGRANFGYPGETGFEREIFEKVKAVESNIRLLGFVHHDELWKVMKVCDFAVLPSMWEEPAGNVVPECMAGGLPLIITNSGGMLEYVDDTCAIVVEKEQAVEQKLAEAMDRLCRMDEKERAAMGECAQHRAGNFDIGIYYDELVRILGAE